MTILTQGVKTLEGLISEAEGTRSREEVTILAGSGAVRALTAGMVLGRRLISATAAAVAGTGNTGNGVMGAITVTGPAQRGEYVLAINEPGANVGQFTVSDPNGRVVGHGAVASAFSAGGLAFTLADGATDFVAGDFFVITVSGGTYKYLRHDTTVTTGEQDAIGILVASVTAPDGADIQGVIIARDAEYQLDYVTFSASATTTQKNVATQQLLGLGIVLRS